jgi:choice-of-anchor B domain-containing protein
MKNIFRSFLTFFLFQASFCPAQMQLNLPLLSHWTDNTLPINWVGGSFNDCWGYVDSLHREYAIIGSTVGAHIFDITNARNTPVLVSFQPGKDGSSSIIHRDYKTYKHYLYAVCDEGNSSLQIFDLKYLPDSVHKVYDSQHLCKTSHNIFIDDGRIYFCGLKDSTGTPVTFRIASLDDPENPVLLGDLTSPAFHLGYVHDVCVRHDTAYLSCASDGMYIYDYTNPVSPALIGIIAGYPENGYNHSSSISADGKTIVIADENHGSGLKVFDISDLSNITLKSIFRSNLLNDPVKQSIPHNPFILGNKVFISYYHDGVQCFDISNTSSPFQAGYYDTHPEDTSYAGYGPGCWGVYPYLPSKHIIGSDIANGLFILDGTQLLRTNDTLDTGGPAFLLISPNPVSQTLMITSNDPTKKEMKVDIYDNLGNLVLALPSYSPGKAIDISYLKQGAYLVNITANEFHLSRKIIKTN